MPLPPKDDPRRPLHLAVFSMRLLGAALLLLALLQLLRLLGSIFTAGGRLPRPLPIMIVAFMIYIAPGAGLILLSNYVKRRRFWAVFAATCVSSMMLMILLLALLRLTIALMDIGNPYMRVAIGVVALLAAAMGLLIYHLARSFAAIRYTAPEERGFEPIMVPPAAAPEMYQQQRDQRHEQPPRPDTSL